jgi:iron complex transport system ATP-binding protein
MRARLAIEFSNVTLARGDKSILKDISWRVRDGDHWAVVGSNGSGKTSMLRIVAGYTWPSQGKISVLGNDFGNIDLRELRKNIGWVSSTFQDQVPPKETALNIVLSGKFASVGFWEECDVCDITYARELLHFMGCGEYASYPFGVLSQGEQQRILIARALMPKPSLLILDEPCAGLDLLARENLLEMIRELGQEKDGPTLILVTHHIEEITSVFSHVMVLKSGSILAQGYKDEVLTGPILSDAFGVPISVIKINDRFWIQIR